jgi:hypothetical protein
MATGYDRRLNRLEDMSAPKRRTVFIWDDHKPGGVEQKKARLIEAGSIDQHDQVVVIGWERPA